MRNHAEIVSHRLDWEDLPAPEGRRAADRAASDAPGFLSRHRTRILAIIFDLKVMVGAGSLCTLLGFPFWPSLAATALVYTSISTALAGRSLGLVVSEWLLRTLRSWPVARRLISSRVEGA
jgi:hypothetical protein